MLTRLTLFCALASVLFTLPLAPTLALSESQQDAAIAGRRCSMMIVAFSHCAALWGRV